MGAAPFSASSKKGGLQLVSSLRRNRVSTWKILKLGVQSLFDIAGGGKTHSGIVGVTSLEGSRSLYLIYAHVH